MINFWKILFILILFGIFLHIPIQAESQTVVTKSKWSQLSKGYNYTETYKTRESNKQKPKKYKSAPLSSLFANLSWVSYLITGIVLVVLAILIIWLIMSLIRASDEKITKNKIPSLVKDYENIEDADLENDLRLALDQHLYNHALRIQYLLVIKSLTRQKMLIWKKDKTNTQYLNEMFGKSGFEMFRTITLCFERAWYGDQVLSESEYLQLVPVFKQLNYQKTELE